MAAYQLQINGKKINAEAAADMPLLWVIRDIVGLKGTKYGCGIAQCGACTIHIDGSPVRSCQIPISTLSKKAKIMVSHSPLQKIMNLDHCTKTGKTLKIS